MDMSERWACRPIAGALSRAWRVVTALALAAATGVAPAPVANPVLILGQRPNYGPALVSDVPNRAAIDRMIWMPGLDAGWDPQGLAIADHRLLISAYRSRRKWRNRGPCRVFRVDPVTGDETGHIDIPAPCGHAGGLAYAGAGELFIADTHTLFEVDLDQAFDRNPPKFRTIPLGRGLKGAFAVSDRGAIWIGDYEPERPAKAFKFALSAINDLNDGAALTPDAASLVVPIPTYGQGGALDSSGRLWVARSDISWGFLDERDPQTGRLYRRFAVTAGIEGIAFDRYGKLWAIAEAGARHLPWHYPFFPMIFRLDPTRLIPVDRHGEAR